MTKAAGVAQDAMALGFAVAKSKLLINPGSELTRRTLERGGQLPALKNAGATVLANACGPCIGNWERSDIAQGESNSILSSYNRNFAGRNDGNGATHAFVASPEIVAAMAMAGKLSFNPLTDSLTCADGSKRFRLRTPTSSSLPRRGFVLPTDVYEAPSKDSSGQQILISSTSQRLQIMPPFAPWDGRDAVKMPVLIKTQGKTTTDAISGIYAP